MAEAACVRAQIMKKGIDYANSVLQERLSNDLKALDIGDHSGEDHGAKWEITRIKISDGGKVKVKVKDARLQVTIKLGADADGRPTVSMADCHVDVHDVDVKFEGGAAFVYNLFRDFCGRKLRDVLKEKVYSIIQKFVNTDGANVMSKLKVSTAIGKYFNLDYGLTQAPSVTDDCIETNHKGKVCWKEDGSEVSLSPLPLPPREGNLSKMLYLELSEHIVNSMASLAHKNNLIQFKYKAEQIPDKLRSALLAYLSFLSEGQISCETIPENQLHMSLTATSAPVIAISNDVMDVNIKSDVSLMLDKAEEETLLLCTLNVDVCLSLQAIVADEQLRAKLVNQRFRAEIIEAAFDVNPVLDEFLQGLLSVSLAYTVNDILKKGIALPVMDDLKFTETTVQLLHGSCIISTDVQCT